MTSTDDKHATADVLAGGCVCGELRYALRGPIIDAGYCHCRRCQRASGAPVTVWLSTGMGTGAGDFAYTHGAPTIYRAATGAQREFCPACGTGVVLRSDAAPAEVDVAVASLDRPQAITPVYHIWCASRIRWLDDQGDLPRYDDAGPDRGSPGG